MAKMADFSLKESKTNNGGKKMLNQLEKASFVSGAVAGAKAAGAKKAFDNAMSRSKQGKAESANSSNFSSITRNKTGPNSAVTVENNNKPRGSGKNAATNSASITQRKPGTGKNAASNKSSITVTPKGSKVSSGSSKSASTKKVSQTNSKNASSSVVQKKKGK